MDDLNIILPVHNEVKTLTPLLDEWNKQLIKFNTQYHFIICEDGSTDGTKKLLHKMQKKYKLILNLKEKRRGYGRAVLDGIKIAKSQYILCIDSDGQCDPKDLIKFWKNKDRANVLIGWRKKRQDNAQRQLFSFLFKIVFKLLFPSAIHDPSAPFVIFNRKKVYPYLSYLKYLNEGFWWGFTGMCVKNKLKLKEFKICHRKRLSGETRVYKSNTIIPIAFRNIVGLLQLYFAQ